MRSRLASATAPEPSLPYLIICDASFFYTIIGLGGKKMYYKYYCPYCGEFSEEDVYSAPKKIISCDSCGERRFLITSCEAWDDLERNMSSKEFAELKKSFIKNVFDDLEEEIEEEERKKEEEAREREKIKQINERKKHFIVTTADLKQDYEVVSPVYIQVNNRSNSYKNLEKKYNEYLQDLQNAGQRSNDSPSGIELLEVLFLNPGADNGHSNFDAAFYIAVEELKERAILLGADAIVGM